MKAEAVERLLGSAVFTELDRHFARFVERLSGATFPELALAAALVSQQRNAGHICVDLAKFAGNVFPEESEFADIAVTLPKINMWERKLAASGIVGGPGEDRPLILDGQGRLYLQRYWEYESKLANAITARLQSADNVDLVRLGEGLKRLFKPLRAGEVDWQKVAAFAAVTRKFCVISGGPGTGKTRTVVTLLALLLEQSVQLRVAIAAPTGKAAARLQESIKLAKAELNCAAAVKARLPEAASTIHRLLGAVPNSPYFRHDAKNPLPVDVVVIDEASMVDVALMAKLFDAIPPHARVVLLGDKDQLSSVEAGAVLGDICAPEAVNVFSKNFTRDYAAATGERLPERGGGATTLADSIVELQTNYRFGETNGIFATSRAVNSAASDEALKLLISAGSGGTAITWQPTPRREKLKAALRARILESYPADFDLLVPSDGLKELQRFRILCALREGPFGVSAVNRLVEEILIEAGRVQKAGAWYAGRPVMVLENDYPQELFNGDVGITLHDPATKQLRVYFSGRDGAPRAILPVRLPAHETVHAMTVHKSQGSEFAEVLLILPGVASPILSRELIYTGLTRASRRIDLWATEGVLRSALGTMVSRESGLRSRLAGKKVS